MQKPPISECFDWQQANVTPRHGQEKYHFRQNFKHVVFNCTKVIEINLQSTIVPSNFPITPKEAITRTKLTDLSLNFMNTPLYVRDN